MNYQPTDAQPLTYAQLADKHAERVAEIRQLQDLLHESEKHSMKLAVEVAALEDAADRGNADLERMREIVGGLEVRLAGRTTDVFYWRVIAGIFAVQAVAGLLLGLAL